MAPSLPRMGYLEPRLDWGYHGLRYRLRRRGGEAGQAQKGVQQHTVQYTWV